MEVLRLSDSKKIFAKVKKTHLYIAGISLLILLVACLLWFNNSTSLQSEPALMAKVYFEGEYRVADGDWQKIIESLERAL